MREERLYQRPRNFCFFFVARSSVFSHGISRRAVLSYYQITRHHVVPRSQVYIDNTAIQITLESSTPLDKHGGRRCIPATIIQHDIAVRLKCHHRVAIVKAHYILAALIDGKIFVATDTALASEVSTS